MKCLEYVSEYWNPAPQGVKITYKRGELCKPLYDEYLYRSYATCEENNFDEGKEYVFIHEVRTEYEWGWVTDREHKRVVRKFKKLVECLDKRKVPYVIYENDNPDFYAVVVEIYRPVKKAD